MNLSQVDVFYEDGEWRVLIIPKDKRQKPYVLQGRNDRPLGFQDRSHAWAAGRGIAAFTETDVVGKNREGVIRDKDSFGNDPRGKG